jgi:hypothetical protein
MPSTTRYRPGDIGTVPYVVVEVLIAVHGLANQTSIGVCRAENKASI